MTEVQANSKSNNTVLCDQTNKKTKDTKVANGISHSKTHVFEPAILIGIDGNISSGKSTGCKMIENMDIDNVKVICQYETINKILLELFCNNQKEYAFPLQLLTMTRRMQDMEKLRLKYTNNKNVVILDRTMLGDFVFAIKHLLSGNISDIQMKVYVEESKMNDIEVIVKKQHVNSIIYLHSTPTICRYNVSKRDDVDKDYKEDYLNQVDDLHFYAVIYSIINKKIPIYFADWRKFGDFKELFTSVYNDVVSSKTDLKNDSKVKRSISKISFYEKEMYDSDKSNKVKIDYDDPKYIEKIPESSFNKLHTNKLLSGLTFRHTQEWKNIVAEALDQQKHLYLVRNNPNQLTLLDLFDIISKIIR